MKRYRGLFTGAVVALSLNANAAMVTLSGTTVDFTFDDSLLSIFGTPIVLGDKLVFTPSTFVANANNADGIRIANATVNIDVTAKSGWNLSSVSLFENGDYWRIQDTAPAQVALGGQFRVDSAIYAIAPDAPLSATTDFLNFATTNWSSSITATGIDPLGIHLTLQNILLARSLALGDGAFIEKKLAEIELATVPVPVPAPIVLLISALASMFVVGRRKDQREQKRGLSARVA